MTRRRRNSFRPSTQVRMPTETPPTDRRITVTLAAQMTTVAALGIALSVVLVAILSR